MADRDWTAELQERIEREIDAAMERGAKGDTNMEPTAGRIMADVEMFGVLKAREGFARGWKHFNSSPDHQMKEDYPLPLRTHCTMREEPDPHGLPLVYAYFPGDKQVLVRGRENRYWGTFSEVFPPYGGILFTDARIDLWASLKAEPCITKRAPADEDNPWPEVEP